LEIGVYEPPGQSDSTPDGSQCRASSPVLRAAGPSGHPLTRYGRHGVAISGLLASVVLHALLITSLAWGGRYARVPQPRSPDLRAPGSSGQQDDEFSMELVPIRDDSAPRAGQNEMPAPPTFVPVTVQAALTDPTFAPVSDPDGSAANVSDSDAAAQAILVGRYMGQIDARIERAWRRPRTTVEEGLFSCRVRIEQDAQGGVKEITLERCNGDARWQVSLVQAIQLASPLPAPPDPKVFARVLRMDFRAEPYSPDAPQDEYER